MIQILKMYAFVFCIACLSPAAYAIQIDTENDWRFAINGFLDAQYDYVDAVPVVGGIMAAPTVASSVPASNLSQEHLNVLISAQKDNTKFFINLDSHPPLAEVHAGGSTTQVRLAEAYGELRFGNSWALRAGQFNAPFSMFNKLTYMVPLFASVNLPLMYLMPGAYHGGQDGIADSASVRHNLMPAQANLMLSTAVTTDGLDWIFDLYLTAGARNHDKPSLDANNNKGLGGRMQMLDSDERFSLGISAYAVNNDGAGEFPAIENVGDELLLGADATFSFWQEQLKFELEWVYNQFEQRQDRLVSSLRVSNRFSDASLGFVSLQYMRDNAHPVFYRGMYVYSAGYTYNWSTNVMFKGEYHLHAINTDDTTGLALPADTDRFSMMKSSLSFMF